MRFFVWVCRLILLVVVGAFVATVFYMTQDVGTDMESAKPVLNLVTVIGAGLLGLVWPLMRRYWQAFLLLIGMGVLRTLFAADPGLSNSEDSLLTPFQADYIWFAIGVTGFVLVVALVARAVLSDRKLRTLRQVTKLAAAAPAPELKHETAETSTAAVTQVSETIESAQAEVVESAEAQPAQEESTGKK